MSANAVYNSLKSITVLHRWVRSMKRSIAGYRRNFWVMEGQERASHQPLKLFFSGQPENRNYFADLIMGDTCTQTEQSRGWRWRLPGHALAGRAGYDLAIVQVSEPPDPGRLGRNRFAVPCWVGREKDLYETTLLARRSDHIKSDVRRIRKNKLGYRVTRDPAEFDRFYETMYLPYIKDTFGDCAMLMSYESMKAALDQCELFLITQDGEDIAGGILVYDETDRVRGWSLGVKDGDMRWVRAGALAAFEYLQTDYLLEKGYKRLHRGGSRPFLRDGALSFKKNRGMAITGQKSCWFLLLPLRSTAAVRSFFINNPFIYTEAGTMKGAVFLPDGVTADDDTSKLLRDLYIDGLDTLTLFSLNTDNGQQLAFRSCGSMDPAGVLHMPLRAAG